MLKTNIGVNRYECKCHKCNFHGIYYIESSKVNITTICPACNLSVIFIQTPNEEINEIPNSNH